MTHRRSTVAPGLLPFALVLTIVVPCAGCAKKPAPTGEAPAGQGGTSAVPAAEPSTPSATGLPASPGGEAAAPPTEIAATAPVASPALIEPEKEPFIPESGFWLLKLADFDYFPADAATWTEQHGVLICSGTPKGYAYTREDFENFTLRCEFRFVPTGAPPNAETAQKFNTGFMLCIQEPHKVWPASLEVQGRFDEMASIKSNGGVPALTISDDPTARETARLPVGQWNAIEIVSHNGAVSATLNGRLICTSQPGELNSGKLGLQSEGFPVHFRHLRVRLDN
jgi:hypothetical protein